MVTGPHEVLSQLSDSLGPLTSLLFLSIVRARSCYISQISNFQSPFWSKTVSGVQFSASQSWLQRERAAEHKSRSRSWHPKSTWGPLAHFIHCRLEIVLRWQDSLAMKNRDFNLDKTGFHLDLALTSGEPGKVSWVF